MVTTAPRPPTSKAFTDRLPARLEGLPGPLWAALAVGIALGIVLLHVTEWIMLANE